MDDDRSWLSNGHDIGVGQPQADLFHNNGSAKSVVASPCAKIPLRSGRAVIDRTEIESLDWF